MAERKVLTKYYHPDFDPSLLPKTTKPKNRQQEVRLMLPMSIQCLTCGEYLNKGKKFNGRKEEVVGETYLGIKIYRLYFKCLTCLSEITFKTDPEHSDYVVERGGSRGFEPWRAEKQVDRLEQAKREREEMGDTMKVLENRTEASKREMEIQDAIEEVRELTARGEMLTTEQLLGYHIGAAEQLEEEQIEAMAAAAFAKKEAANRDPAASRTRPQLDDSHDDAAATTGADSTLPVIKRLPDPVDWSRTDSLPLTSKDGLIDSQAIAATSAAADSLSGPATPFASVATAIVASPSVSTGGVGVGVGLRLVQKRKKSKEDDPDRARRKKEKRAKQAATDASTSAAPAPTPTTEAPPTAGLGGLLGDYGDDSD